MKKTYLIPLLVAGLSLSACETLDNMGQSVSGIFSGDQSSAEAQQAEANTIMKAEASANCPSIQIMSDLKSLAQFVDDTAPSAETNISSINIMDVETACNQTDKATEIALTITFDGQTGPKARGKNSGTANFSYPYFIAVTDSNGDILAKEIFAASLSYSKGQDTVKQIETINQLLPNTSEVSGYNILVGFQLNEAQLQYNRDQAAKAAESAE